MSLGHKLKLILVLTILFSTQAYAVHCLEGLHEVGKSTLTATVKEIRVDMADVLAVDMTRIPTKPYLTISPNASFYYFPKEGNVLEITGLKGKRIYMKPGLIDELAGKKPEERLSTLIESTHFNDLRSPAFGETHGKYIFVNSYNEARPRLIQLSDNETFEAFVPIHDDASILATLRENNPIGFNSKTPVTYSIDLYTIESGGYSVNTITVQGFKKRPSVRLLNHPILGVVVQVGDRNFRLVMEVHAH